MCHEITPPKGVTDKDVIDDLYRRANYYERNTAKNKIKYELADENCQCFAFSLLLSAGCSKTQCIKAGEFPGFDWGEEQIIGGFDEPVP